MEYKTITNAVISELKVPVLLARHEHKRKGDTVVFHSTDSLPRDFARRAETAFSQRGLNVSCEVKLHSARRLARVQSLESLQKLLGAGEVVYDPTHLVARSTALVTLAKWLRAEIPNGIGSIGFEGRRRTLYVILNEQKHQQTAKAVHATMQKARTVVMGWQKSSNPDFDIAIRIGFDGPPSSRLVCVDAASIMFNVRNAFSRRASQLFRNAGLAALFGLGSSAVAVASEPAVSQPNMSIMGRGGSVDGDGRGDAGIKGTLPIGHSFGLQLEGGVGSDDYHGLGANLFWRDPSVGMVGIFGTSESLDNIDMQRFGLEGEMYFNRISLGATAGHQDGDVDNGAFGRLDLKFYATPDFVMKAGGEFTDNFNFGRIGVEWRPAFESLPGLSVFADGEFGEDGHDAVYVGLKYHFGAKGLTLINRDRREDPDFHIFNQSPLQNAAKQGYTPAQFN